MLQEHTCLFKKKYIKTNKANMYALLNKTWTLLANAKAVSKIKQNQNHATIYSACAYRVTFLVALNQCK